MRLVRAPAGFDLRVTGRRYRDVFEPDDGSPPIVFAGALPSTEPPSPRRPLFALHPSVRVSDTRGWGGGSWGWRSSSGAAATRSS